MSEITIIASCVCVGSAFYFVKRQHSNDNSYKKYLIGLAQLQSQKLSMLSSWWGVGVRQLDMVLKELSILHLEGNS